MGYTIRVSLPGVPALESSPDPRDYSLLADEDNVLIKEHSRGSLSVATYSTENVSHDLGYPPHFYTYGEISSGRFQVANGYNLFGAFRTGVDASKLILYNRTGSTKVMRFFIFYDDIPE